MTVKELDKSGCKDKEGSIKYGGKEKQRYALPRKAKDYIWISSLTTCEFLVKKSQS